MINKKIENLEQKIALKKKDICELESDLYCLKKDKDSFQINSNRYCNVIIKEWKKRLKQKLRPDEDKLTDNSIKQLNLISLELDQVFE